MTTTLSRPVRSLGKQAPPGRVPAAKQILSNAQAGRAVIQDGGKTFAVNLSPAEPNMFVGQVPMPLGSKARVVFSAKVPGHTLQARFTTD